jgi:hypothetical protein
VTNTEVVGAFLDRRPGSTRNLTTDGHKMFSYGVKVAEWLSNGLMVESRETLEKRGSWWSRTTARHIGMVRREAGRRGIKTITAN